MVELLDPPVAETRTTSKKRGGGPRSLNGTCDHEKIVSKLRFVRRSFSARTWPAVYWSGTGCSMRSFTQKRGYEQMCIADMALAKARMDRAAELQVENENRYIDRTINYWQYDQECRAIKLKARLSRNPAQVAHALLGFKQGVDLMITMWEALAGALQATGQWDEEQRRLCLDLQGVSLELRAGNWIFPPTVGKADLAATAAREIERLHAREEEWLDEHDEYAQDDALSGLAPEDDATTKRLRRYENMARREYDKAFAELMRVKAEGEARFRESGIKSTLRAWDVDSLIERIKGIQEPPGLRAEIQEALGPIPRVDEGHPVANSPDAAVASRISPVVAPDESTPPRVAGETTTTEAGDTQDESDSVSPASVAPADSTAPRFTIVPPPVILAEDVEKPPLSRRARKELQMRLRLQQAAPP